MDSCTMARIVEILETDPDFYVPIKKLWLMIQREGLELDTELEDFHHVLKKDERFEFSPGVDHAAGYKNSPNFASELEQEMESLGFYSGPRVKLVDRKITAEEIFAGMARSLNRMNQALHNAWDARPEDDQETEDQLLKILAAGQKLEREIQDLVDHQE